MDAEQVMGPKVIADLFQLDNTPMRAVLLHDWFVMWSRCVCGVWLHTMEDVCLVCLMRLSRAS